MKLSYKHQEHILTSLDYMQRHIDFFGTVRVNELQKALDEYMQNKKSGYSTVSRESYRVLVLASLLAIEYERLDREELK